MKVAQIIPCLGKNSGGPSRSVYSLSQGLREVGVDIVILTQDYACNTNIVAEDWIDALPVNKVKPFEYNPEFKKLLKDRIRQGDIQLFHINSVYSYPTFIAASLARKAHLPYIITPRGSLYHDVLEVSSKWKKRLFNSLFLIRQLNHASVVHVTCSEEMEAIRKLRISSPVAIIPNSITLPNERPVIDSPDLLRICYLGRINIKKNIMGLIKAWHNSGLSNDHNAELVIIGAAQLDKEKCYLSNLHKLESDLAIDNIRWAGSKEGAEKEMILRSCSFLIMPSFSENFGMVVPEALQYGIPVVASKGTPWQILEEKNCGWWVDADVDSLASCLKHLQMVSKEDRYNMGLRGQQLVWDHFSTKAVCKMQIELYNWILNGGEKPEFVFL